MVPGPSPPGEHDVPRATLPAAPNGGPERLVRGWSGNHMRHYRRGVSVATESTPRRAATVAALAVLFLLVGIAAAPAGSAASEPAAASSFEWGPCPEQVPAEQAARVRCGTLTVPENRTEGSDSERTIQLPVAVVPSSSASPRPDPVVFPTSGGPGGGSLSSLWYFLYWADWATSERDVVLLEQRGDQLSQPTLNCPELDVEKLVVDGHFVTRSEARQAKRACHDRLIGEGIDLASYTSSATAADLQDLRDALGYDQWNLYGISYGSRVALTAMRDQPAGLRAVVLDGVYPPNGQQFHQAAGFSEALQAMLSACATDPSCQTSYPDLAESLATVLERTRESPIVAEVRTPRTRTPMRLEISDADVLSGLHQALYDNDTTRALPFVIDQLAQGNDEVIVPLAQQELGDDDYLTEGLQSTLNCAEEIAFYSDDPEPAADQWARAWAEVNPPPRCDDSELSSNSGLEDHGGGFTLVSAGGSSTVFSWPGPAGAWRTQATAVPSSSTS